jgi:hypothetical protein
MTTIQIDFVVYPKAKEKTETNEAAYNANQLAACSRQAPQYGTNPISPELIIQEMRGIDRNIVIV